MSMFSDLWGLGDDNEDLEGFEELQLDRAHDDDGERHSHVHSRADLRRSKRNLMLGLMGTILLIGSLWWAIARLNG